MAIRGLVERGAATKIIAGEEFLNENSKVKTVWRVNFISFKSACFEFNSSLYRE